MPLNDDQNCQVASLATLLIENLSAVEAAAEVVIRQGPSGPVGDVFAATANPMVGPNRAGYQIDAIHNALWQDLYRIRTEPFVAYVLVESEGGKRQRYFFARGMPSLDFHGAPFA
jgi:hypothetical protein